VENLWIDYSAIPVGRLREDTTATPQMSLSMIGFVTFAETSLNFLAYQTEPFQMQSQNPPRSASLISLH
jgi:hypothetical protein